MFATQLNKLIEDHKVSVYKISKDTGIPATTMYDWVNDKTKPGFDYVVKLSKYFGVPINYFIE